MNSEFLQQTWKHRIAQLQPEAESWTPQLVLNWAFDSLGRSVAISSAFGPEGMAVIDMASRLRGADFRLFTLDTEFLFPETYALIERIEQRYGITIERVYPEQSPEEQQRAHGAALWSRNPDLCCNLRKVEPLRRKLSSLAAWITSIRRDQTPARAGAHKVEWDAKFELVKINPIADWTTKQVWQYLRDHDVPYNPSARSPLSQHRMHPLHPLRGSRRRRSRRTLGRLRKERVRPACYSGSHAAFLLTRTPILCITATSSLLCYVYLFTGGPHVYC